MDSFPPNSKTGPAAPPPAPEPKKVQRVTTGEAVRRKRRLGSKFKETFIGGDAKGAAHYVFLSVIVPSAKDLLAEAAQTGIERLIYGETKASRRTGAPQNGYAGIGRVNYQGMSNGPNTKAEQRTLPRTSRSRHDFSDIVIQSRADADEVLDQMFALLNHDGSIAVGDLYELCGIRPDHVDYKWGWTELAGAGVKQLRGGQGYLLVLPDPIQFR